MFGPQAVPTWGLAMCTSLPPGQTPRPASAVSLPVLTLWAPGDLPETPGLLSYPRNGVHWGGGRFSRASAKGGKESYLAQRKHVQSHCLWRSFGNTITKWRHLQGYQPILLPAIAGDGLCFTG